MRVNNNTSKIINQVFSTYNLKLPIYYFSDIVSEYALNNVDKLKHLITPEMYKDALGVYIGWGLIAVFNFNESRNTYQSLLYDSKSGKEITKIDRLVDRVAGFVLTLYTFKKYAEVETKILPPKSKQGNTIKCKYINQTNHSITYLDSKWFTNLIKSDAFKVSGHFRLQPCKDENGLPTKKLIWINDFIKSGYTSPARKLKYENI